MTRTAKLKFATSALIVALGFGMPGANVAASDSSAVTVNPSRAASQAERAQRMMERGRPDRAIEHAEAAVGYDLRNASYRALLGQAYLAAGRFVSAEASFDAARQLGAGDTRSIIGHALALVATGRSNDALRLLDDNATTLPASDLGLAIALAGQPERGVMILTDVIRAGDSTARDRQNLALSYAIAGRWLEARLLAAQDLGPARVGDRIQQWAAMLGTPDPRLRVAGLLGTTVGNDSGMPVRFALNAAPSPVLVMAEDPAPIALYAPPPPVEVAELASVAVPHQHEPAPALALALAPAPVDVAAIGVADPAPVAAAPVSLAEARLVFVSNPVIQPLRSVVAMVAPLRGQRVDQVAEPVVAEAAAGPATRVARSGPVRTSGWVVQLGAYETAAIARGAWPTLASRHASLAAADGVATTVTVNGRSYHRLNATGFDSRASALAACNAISAHGGRCFVRNMTTSEQPQWASRRLPTRVASR